MLICFLVDDKSRAVYAKGSAERLEYCVRDRIVPLVMCLVSQGFVRSLLGNSPQHLVNVAGLLSFVNQDSVNIAIWLCQLVRDTHVVVRLTFASCSSLTCPLNTPRRSCCFDILMRNEDTQRYQGFYAVMQCGWRLKAGWEN